jgi:tetratricopeptide (TPR) repeat protein
MARDLQRKLADTFPAVTEYRHELARTHSSLALLLTNLEQRDAARTEFVMARDLQQNLVAAFPAVPEYRQELAQTHANLGGLLYEMDQRDAARKEYEVARDLRKELVSLFPAVPDYQGDLATTHSNLALVLVGLGQRGAAHTEYETARGLLLKLVANSPAVPEYQVDLGIHYFNFGRLIRNEGRPAESLHWLDLAIRTLTPVYEQERRDVKARTFLRRSHAARAMAYDALNKHAEAIQDWDRAIELDPGCEQPACRAGRAISRLQVGQTAEAVAEVEELTKATKWSADDWYNFACVNAVASSKIADHKAEYADRAMNLLRQAVKAGYKDAAHLGSDPDLAPLRQRGDFLKLLAELEPGKK